MLVYLFINMNRFNRESIMFDLSIFEILLIIETRFWHLFTSNRSQKVSYGPIFIELAQIAQNRCKCKWFKFHSCIFKNAEVIAHSSLGYGFFGPQCTSAYGKVTNGKLITLVKLLPSESKRCITINERLDETYHYILWMMNNIFIKL